MNKVIVLFFCFLSISFSGLGQSDSTVIETEIKELIMIPFSAEELNTMDVEIKIIKDKKPTPFTSTFFLVLLNLFSIAVLLIHYSRFKVNKMTSTLFNINKLNQYASVEMKRDNNFLFAYFLLTNILIALIIFLFSERFFLQLDVLKIAIFFTVYFIVDSFINKLTAYLLKTKEAYSSIVYNNTTFLVLSLPYLIISVLLITYLPDVVFKWFGYLFLSFTLLTLLVKEIRNVVILNTNKIKVDSFYFFLYLCTFKLMPLILFFKVLVVEILK